MSILKRSEINMTQGPIIKHLVAFSLPLLLGNLFQQFYNMVDTWVVGNYVSDAAFSAVGTVAPILNLFIFSFVGFSQGGAVVISQFFGAGDKENVNKTAHTMLVITIVFCIVFSLAGYFLVPNMVDLMQSPEGVREEQITYLRIIFAFLSFQILYNMTSAMLRAIGDSTRPFMFLVVACLINVALDLLFVMKFKMGVAGVAWATVIAQGVSAMLCLYVLFTTKASVKIQPSELRYAPHIASKIFRLGLPTAIQMAITSFSNIFVQGYVNAFGEDVMGGWTCYMKLDQIVMMPMQSLGMGCTTFVGQNLGAGNVPRAKKGMRQGIFLAMGVTAFLVVGVMVFAPNVSRFFNDSEAIVEYGTFFLRLITPFMLLCCPSMMLISSLRGAGNSKVPMIVTLACYVGVRQLFLFAVSKIFPNNLLAVGLAFPTGWVACCIIMFVYYWKVGFGVKGSIAVEAH